MSADGACNLDVHVHPDCYPAYRSLTTEAVFAQAQTVAADGLTFQAASTDHAFLLCATNAAKDKFGPFAARKIADAMVIARSGKLDGEAIMRIAAAGNYARPLQVFVRLLADLGVDAGDLPFDVHAPLGSRVRGEYARMLDETRRLYPGEPGLAQTLRRELLLSTETAVGLRNAWSRITGLVRRDDGVPEPPELSNAR